MNDFHPSANWPYGQVGNLPALYQKKKNTGLTWEPTNFNIQGVANQGSRFRLLQCTKWLADNQGRIAAANNCEDKERPEGPYSD